MAKQQLIDGPNPELPAALNRGDYLYRVLVKICVSTAGTVDRVTLMKGADALLDEAVMSKVKTWKFRALLANNVPVPFCYPATFEFKPR
jgi:TonB family protein